MGDPKWISKFVQQSLQQESSSKPGSNNGSFYPARIPNPRSREQHLRQRELGSLNAQRFITRHTYRDLTRFRSWTGASKDILSVTWAYDGSKFAVGASTDSDGNGSVYNRNNNLLFGDEATNNLFEQADHHVLRPDAPISAERLTDDRLFTSVSHVTSADNHSTIFTAGYDKTVRIWDVGSSPHPALQHVINHGNPVDFAVPMPTWKGTDPQLLVTGQHCRQHPIQLFHLPKIEDGSKSNGRVARPELVCSFNSDRAAKHDITPSALAWGPDHHTRRYLLAGFAENSANVLTDREGHLLLWDVYQPDVPRQLDNNIENVFDVAWQPGRGVIAAATTPRNTHSLTWRYDTKSVIRTWSPTENPRRIYELECPARDVNDLQFHPTRDLISASCTDGRIYLWDFRMAERILRTLEHGSPIEEFTIRSREVEDVGVRFTSWSQDSRYLYTGSSDGRLACWDILTSDDSGDACAEEIARFDAGIMAGEFSRDHSKLLLGLVKGSFEVLTIGGSPSEVNLDTPIDDSSRPEKPGTFHYVAAAAAAEAEAEVGSEETSGIEAARELLRSKQLVMSEYGPVKGPNYHGPWCMASRSTGNVGPNEPLDPDTAAQQFDVNIGADGQLHGGKSATSLERLLQCAKAITQSVRERDSAVKATAHVNRSGKDRRRRGPDTLELGSLAELAIFDDEAQQLTAPRASAPERVIPSKRPATQDLEMHHRKRMQGDSHDEKTKARPAPTLQSVKADTFAEQIEVIEISDESDEELQEQASPAPKTERSKSRLTPSQESTMSSAPPFRHDLPRTPSRSPSKTAFGTPRSGRLILTPSRPGRNGFIFPPQAEWPPSR